LVAAHSKCKFSAKFHIAKVEYVCLFVEIVSISRSTQTERERKHGKGKEQRGKAWPARHDTPIVREPGQRDNLKASCQYDMRGKIKEQRSIDVNCLETCIQ